MPFDFPSSGLTVGQQVTAPTGAVYVWDGTAWRPVSVPLPPYAPLTSPVFSGDPQVPLAPVGDADQSIASTQFVTRAVAPVQNSVGRNLLHNPLFNVAQRGAGPFTANNAYTADRWKIVISTDTISASIVAQGDGGRAQIGDEACTSVMQLNWTGTSGAGAVTTYQQPIEGVRRLAGKTVTVSFYAAAQSGAPKIGVNFNQYWGSTGGSASVRATPFAVTLSTAWARYSGTITLGSSSGMTLGSAGDDCTFLQFWLSSGANNNAAAGGIGVQSGQIWLWGIQLEIGSVATPLDYGGTPQQQLAQCQRFYQTGQIQLNAWSGAASIPFVLTSPLQGTMRAAPTVAVNGSFTYVNSSTGTFNPVAAGLVTLNFTATAAGQTACVAPFTASADL